MKYPELNEFCEEHQLEKEEWKDVLGWEGLYSVSNLGRVRREKGSRKVLKSHPAGGRYPKVVLSSQDSEKGKQTCSVHRLVATAFVENPYGKPQVNHLNSDVMDARASNLEWTTQSENIRYAFEQGRKLIKRGAESNFCKHSPDFIKQLYLDVKNSSESQRAIGEKHGVTQSFVSSIMTKRNWKELTDLIDKQEVH